MQSTWINKNLECFVSLVTPHGVVTLKDNLNVSNVFIIGWNILQYRKGVILLQTVRFNIGCQMWQCLTVLMDEMQSVNSSSWDITRYTKTNVWCNIWLLYLLLSLSFKFWVENVGSKYLTSNEYHKWSKSISTYIGKIWKHCFWFIPFLKIPFNGIYIIPKFVFQINAKNKVKIYVWKSTTGKMKEIDVQINNR